MKKVGVVDQFGHSTHVETVVLLYHQNEGDYVYVSYEPKDSDYLQYAEGSATYREIKEWIFEKYKLKVSNLYIAQMRN